MNTEKMPSPKAGHVHSLGHLRDEINEYNYRKFAEEMGEIEQTG